MANVTRFEWDVYVSYNSSDESWVKTTLLHDLEQAGLRVAIDYRDFDLGRFKVNNIERAVDSSRHTLLVISPAWLKDSWNEFENTLVSTTDPAGRMRRLIPLLVEPCRLPNRLAALTSADFTGSDDHDAEEMERLIRGLMTKSRVFLSFAHGVEPDESLAGRLKGVLEAEAHHVLTDQEITIGMVYRDGVRAEIEQSDFVVVLLSGASVGDPKVLDQIAFAQEAFKTGKKGHLLPVRVNFLEALPEPISGEINDIHYALWRDESDDEVVERCLLEAISRFKSLRPVVTKVDRRAPVSGANKARLWPNGSVILIAFLDGEPALQWAVAKYAAEWTRFANLRFVFTNDPDAPNRISFSQPGSWATLATDAMSVPKGQPTISLGTLNSDSPAEEIRRVALHEFGHVLGLVHEHQAPGSTIPWNREAVVHHFSTLYGWTLQEIELSIFQAYPADYFPVPKEFDPTSIMAYPIPDEFTDGKVHIGWNRVLSEKDKAFVAALYPCQPGSDG